MIKMSSIPILEKQVRNISSAALYVNASGGWEVGAMGTRMQDLTAVRFNGASVSDQTFDLEALSAETSASGYTLTLRSQTHANNLYTVDVSKSGQVDLKSVKQLSLPEVLDLEESLGLDLNDSSSLGDGSAVLDDGLTDVIVGPDGALSVLDSTGQPVALNFEGNALYHQDLQDEGLEIMEVVPDSSGYLLFMADSALGDVYQMTVDKTGVIGAFDLLWVWDEALQDYVDASDNPASLSQGSEADQSSEVELETRYGVDIQNDQDKALVPGWTSALDSPYLREAIAAATTTGGTLDYSETVALFRGLVEELKSSPQPLVTDKLMADLNMIAARGNSLFSSISYNGQDNEYLANVIGSIVGGSPANGTFTAGQSKAVPLKNLSAGTTAENLSLLVDKWLLGKDMPTPAVGGDSANPNAYSVLGSYKSFDGVLFANTPSVSDIQQGPFGDCYLLASLQAVADSQPQSLLAMFVPNAPVDGHRSWGVRFYDFAGRQTWVTVNDQLPVKNSSAAAEMDNLIIGHSQDSGELWVPLLEKAYAQANETGILMRSASSNSLLAIEGGLFDPIVSILGSGKLSSIQGENFSWGSAPIYSVTINAQNRQQLIDAVAKDINNGKPVGLASFVNTSTAAGETMFTAPHAYFIDDADPTSPTNLTVKVYNPWGVSSGLSGGSGHVSPFDANLADFINSWADGSHFYLQVYGYTGPGAQADGSGQVNSVQANSRLQAKLEQTDGSAYNKLLTAGDDVVQGDAQDNLLYAGHGNDSLSGAAGNDTLDGGTGVDVVVAGGKRDNFRLDLSGDAIRLTSLSGLEGSDTLRNIEKIQFNDGAVMIESRSHGSYADVPDSLYQFFVVGFGAAAGVSYMDQLAEAYRYGLSVQKIVNIFTTKSQFTDAYPTSLSPDALATQLVDRIVKNSATAPAKAEAVSNIKWCLEHDWTVGDVIYTVFGNLASKSSTDITWGATARQFTNQVVVAKYYTESLNQSTTDLPTLRGVMDVVTASTDVTSDAVVAELIGMALLKGA